MTKKIGRPLHGNKPKQRLKFTLDFEVIKKLSLEPNKSGLINDLLRKHYKLNAVESNLESQA